MSLKIRSINGGGTIPDILCDAVPFCYGPISKLLTISEKLSNFADLTLLASGTSKELGQNGPFKRIVDCNTESLTELKKNKIFFKEADIFVNIMNPTSTRFAKQLGIPIVQVDSLFWMWEEIPPEVAASDFYFIQNFDGVERQLQRFGKQIKNPILVGPIIMPKPAVNKTKNQLLVNFGGIESSLIKIGKNSNYPFTMCKLLCKLLEENSSFDSVLFVGLGKIMEKLQKQYNYENFRFTHISHNNFLKELAASKMLLSAPGLTSSFEAFSFGVPTFFLPPQNYSQYWNLKKLNNHGLVYRNTNWDVYYSDLKIGENEPEAEGVKKVLTAVNRFDKEKAHTDLEKQIKDILKIDERTAEEIKLKQSEYFNSLGGNGTDTIVLTIKSFLKGKK